MNLAAIDNSPLASTPTRSADVARNTTSVLADGFERSLGMAVRDPSDVESQVREQATQLVGLALFVPLLRQMRDDPMKSDLTHGGFGEDALTEHFDQEVAARLAERGGAPIAQVVTRRVMQAIAAQAQQPHSSREARHG